MIRSSAAILFLSLLVCFGWAGSDDTVIKGGKMELINKGAEIIFSSGVRMEQGRDVVEANEMRTNKERDKITAIGNVRLFRQSSSTETWRGLGEKGFFDTSAGGGYLIGGKKQAYLVKKDVLSSTSTRVVELWADRIDFFRENKSAKATGNVQGRTEDVDKKETYQFFSDQADYDGKTRVLTLSGKKKSKAIQVGEKSKREVKGRVITFFVESNRMISDGEAEAVMEKSIEGKK